MLFLKGQQNSRKENKSHWLVKNRGCAFPVFYICLNVYIFHLFNTARVRGIETTVCARFRPFMLLVSTYADASRFWSVYRRCDKQTLLWQYNSNFLSWRISSIDQFYIKVENKRCYARTINLSGVLSAASTSKWSVTRITMICACGQAVSASLGW